MKDGLYEVARNGNGLATCVRLFRFTLAMVKAFLATRCSVDGTTARARQMSQGDAKTLLD